MSLNCHQNSKGHFQHIRRKAGTFPSVPQGFDYIAIMQYLLLQKSHGNLWRNCISMKVLCYYVYLIEIHVTKSHHLTAGLPKYLLTKRSRVHPEQLALTHSRSTLSLRYPKIHLSSRAISHCS